MEDPVTLYRPTGPKELSVVAASRWRRWPPRLPEQPIFYPVTNEPYARDIAERWNVKESGARFVTRFAVRRALLDAYQRRVVGAREHEEYWIPAEELDTFNDAILGEIEVVAAFGEVTPAFVPGLRLAESRIEFSSPRPTLPPDLHTVSLFNVATLSASYVSSISEEFWAAGWLRGAGATCLAATKTGRTIGWGHGTFEPAVLEDLGRLRDRLDPWWVEWEDSWGGVSLVPASSLLTVG